MEENNSKKGGKLLVVGGIVGVILLYTLWCKIVNGVIGFATDKVEEGTNYVAEEMEEASYEDSLNIDDIDAVGTYEMTGNEENGNPVVRLGTHVGDTKLSYGSNYTMCWGGENYSIAADVSWNTGGTDLETLYVSAYNVNEIAMNAYVPYDDIQFTHEDVLGFMLVRFDRPYSSDGTFNEWGIGEGTGTYNASYDSHYNDSSSGLSYNDYVEYANWRDEEE